MRHLIFVLSLTLITSCGWHLRGVMPLPDSYQVLNLQSQAGNSFNQQLTLQLEFNGATLTSTTEDAQAILSIDPVDIEKRTLSVSSTGQIAEYELNARLNARVISVADGNETALEFKARRRLTNDVDNVVGTASAEREQRADIEKELVRKLLRRLQALGNKPTSAASEPNGVAQ